MVIHSIVMNLHAPLARLLVPGDTSEFRYANSAVRLYDSQVLLAGYWLECSGRTFAPTVVADVVNIQAIRDGTDEVGVRNPVRPGRFPVDPERAVPLAGSPPSPHPAIMTHRPLFQNRCAMASSPECQVAITPARTSEGALDSSRQSVCPELNWPCNAEVIRGFHPLAAKCSMTERGTSCGAAGLAGGEIGACATTTFGGCPVADLDQVEAWPGRSDGHPPGQGRCFRSDGAQFLKSLGCGGYAEAQVLRQDVDRASVLASRSSMLPMVPSPGSVRRARDPLPAERLEISAAVRRTVPREPFVERSSRG